MCLLSFVLHHILWRDHKIKLHIAMDKIVGDIPEVHVQQTWRTLEQHAMLCTQMNIEKCSVEQQTRINLETEDGGNAFACILSVQSSHHVK